MFANVERQFVVSLFDVAMSLSRFLDFFGYWIVWKTRKNARSSVLVSGEFGG
jgi:hypothetical protein